MGGTTGRKGRYGHYVMHCASCAFGGCERRRKIICLLHEKETDIGSTCDDHLSRRSRFAKGLTKTELVRIYRNTKKIQKNIAHAEKNIRQPDESIPLH